MKKKLFSGNLKDIFSPQKSIKLKIMYMTIAIVILVSLVICIFGVLITKNDKKKSLAERMEDICITLIDGISEKSNNILKEVEIISKSNELKTYISNFDENYIIQIFVSKINLFYEISYININYEEELKVFNGEKTQDYISFKNNENFINFAKSENINYIYSEEFILGDSPCLRIFYKIKDEYLDTIGFLSCVIKINVLIEDIILKKFENSGFVYVVNMEGKIIYHINKDVIFKQLNEKGNEKSDLVISIRQMSNDFLRCNLMGIDGWIYYTPHKDFKWSIIATLPNKQFIKPINNFLFSFAIIIIISIIICFFIVNIVTNIILEGLIEVNKLTDIMTKGDLTQKVQIKTKDEIGMMSNNFNSFIITLNNLIKHIKQSVLSTLNISSNLESTSKESSTSLKEIKFSIENIKDKTNILNTDIISSNNLAGDVKTFISKVAELITTQATDINESSAAIEEMTSSIKSVTQTTEDKMKIVDKLKDIAESGGKEMEETINIITKIVESTNVIMEILKVINNITSQTNLLAMNAAIEAAHSGEYGKGFSVVADEIRELSENTTKNSKEISISLKNVIQNIHSSENSVDKTGKYFKNIVSGISEVSNGMLEIKNAMHELSTGSNQIMEALSSLINSSTTVKESSDQMIDKIGIIKISLENINTLSNNTKISIEEITLRVNELQKSVQVVSDSGKQNSENVKDIEGLLKEFKT